MRTSSASVGIAMLAFLPMGPVAWGAEAPPSLREEVGFGPLSGFTLKDSRDGTFRPEDLRGKVWVAHFFFTTCPAGCEKTTETMAKLQETFRGHPHLALVSISLNPENDSPEVLRAYAGTKNAAPAQWLFLTGPEEEVHEIVQTQFFQTAKRIPDEKPGFDIVHSFHLMLVDHEGRLSGFADGREETLRPALEERIGELLRARQAALEPARVILPRLNAALNATCAVLLLAGWLAIRQRKERLHIACMTAALLVSAAFLACYLYYHFAILHGRPTLFRGEGWARGLYFGVLLSHTALAVIVAPLAIYVTVLGWRDRRPRHVKVARWTLPIWLYVSLTGVAVYWMLYHWYPPY